MSGICGWAGFGAGEQAQRELIERMAAELNRFDGGASRTHTHQQFGIACAAPRNQFALHVADDLFIALAGGPRINGVQPAPGASTNSGAQVLAHAYREQGAKCLSSLAGAFALAIIDRRDGTTLLGIDRMGIQPLTYTVVGGALIFGSNTDSINRHTLVQPQLDAQGLYNYVYFHMVPGPATIYSGLRRLLPGQYVLFRDGVATTQSYWEMRFEEHHKRSFGELREEFLALLRTSVSEAATGPNVGSFLSGGTDSSSVAGMLGLVSGKPARTYSIGFEAAGYDEMGYARIAAKHFGTQHHEYYVTPDDVADAIPQIASVYDQPFGNASALPTYYCAKLARADGIETLLGGDGGDELFGGNERYATQYLFSIYERMPAALRKTLVEPLVFGIPGGQRIPVVRRMRGYIEKAMLPLPARLEIYNLVERFGNTEIFTRDFIAQVDTTQPLALLGEVYHGAHADSLINHMLALDLKFTLADNDLPKVSRTCELAQVGIAYPMLNDALVAFSAQLEPRLKLKGTRLRYFFKEALRGFLPDTILAKQKHGFGLPFGPWLRENLRLQDIVNSSVNDLKKRGIVRPEFIDQLIGTHIADHPGYYGTMAWVLMMLEQWFCHHRH